MAKSDWILSNPNLIDPSAVSDTDCSILLPETLRASVYNSALTGPSSLGTCQSSSTFSLSQPMLEILVFPSTSSPALFFFSRSSYLVLWAILPTSTLPKDTCLDPSFMLQAHTSTYTEQALLTASQNQGPDAGF